MAATEHGRIVLYRHFEAEMGEEKARTLMDHLLPIGWTDLATKQELSQVKQDVREVKQDVRQLKQDVRQLKEDVLHLKHDVGEVRQELTHIRETMATKADVADLRAEMYKGFTSLTLTLVGAMIGLQGLLLAGLKFL